MQVEHFKLIQDIDGYFTLFQNRIDDIIAPLPKSRKDEFEDEMSGFRNAVINNLKQGLAD